MADEVQEGDHVLLMFSDEARVFCVVRKGRMMRVHPTDFDLGGLIGARYGDVFEVSGRGDLSLVPSGELLPPVLPGLPGLPGVDAEGGADTPADNRHLTDTNTSQALQMEEIARLREAGTTGSEIVAALVEHSATFASKTAYSQEKYLKKKTAKYVPRFRCTRPTAQSITDTLIQKMSDRICGLRSDSLSQMLTHANVRWNSTVMIFDGVGGLLIGAVAERTGGCATILTPLEDARMHPRWPHLAKFNFGRQIQGPEPDAAADSRRTLRILSVAYSELAQTAAFSDEVARRLESMDAASSSAAVPAGSAAAAAGTKRSRPEGDAGDPMIVAGDEAALPSAAAAVGAAGKQKKSKRRRDEEKPMEKDIHEITPDRSVWPERQRLLLGGVDCVLIATPAAPTNLLLAALRFLRPSGCFAVFSQEAESLGQAHRLCTTWGLAANMQLFETWTREHQVLPKRTHPKMIMHGASGFVLTGHALAHSYLAAKPPARASSASAVATSATK